MNVGPVGGKPKTGVQAEGGGAGMGTQGCNWNTARPTVLEK
jgi:hypothetical protein